MNASMQYVQNEKFPIIFPAFDFEVVSNRRHGVNAPEFLVEKEYGPIPTGQVVLRVYSMSLLPIMLLIMFIGLYGLAFKYHRHVLISHPIMSDETSGVSDFMITAAIYDNVSVISEFSIPSNGVDYQDSLFYRDLVNRVWSGMFMSRIESNSFPELGRVLHDRFAIDLLVSRRVKDNHLDIYKVDALSVEEITNLLSLNYDVVYSESISRVWVSEKIRD